MHSLFSLQKNVLNGFKEFLVIIIAKTILTYIYIDLNIYLYSTFIVAIYIAVREH